MKKKTLKVRLRSSGTHPTYHSYHASHMYNCRGGIREARLITTTPRSIHSYQAATILDLKRGCRGIKIAKMANDHRSVIMANGMIVVKIYLTLILQVFSSDESARHL